MSFETYCDVQQVIGSNKRFVIPADRPYHPGASERCVEIPYVFSMIGQAGKILDVGISLADQGYFSGLLCLQGMGRQLHGCDIVPFAKVRNRFSAFNDHGLERIHFSCTDIRASTYEDECFDLVLCVSVLEHIGFDKYIEADDTVFDRPFIDYEFLPDYMSWNEDQRALKEMLRIVKRNGRILLTVPYGSGGIFTSKDSKGRFAAHLEYNYWKWTQVKSILEQSTEFKERCFKMTTRDGWFEVAPDVLFEGAREMNMNKHLDQGVLCVEITRKA